MPSLEQLAWVANSKVPTHDPHEPHLGLQSQAVCTLWLTGTAAMRCNGKACRCTHHSQRRCSQIRQQGVDAGLHVRDTLEVQAIQEAAHVKRPQLWLGSITSVRVQDCSMGPELIQSEVDYMIPPIRC